MSCNLTLCKPSQKKSQPHNTLGLFFCLHWCKTTVPNRKHLNQSVASHWVWVKILVWGTRVYRNHMCPNANDSWSEACVLPSFNVHLSSNEIIQASLTLHLYVTINERETTFPSTCPEPVIAWQERQIHDSDCSACAGSGHHPDADTLAPGSLPTE